MTETTNPVPAATRAAHALRRAVENTPMRQHAHGWPSVWVTPMPSSAGVVVRLEVHLTPEGAARLAALIEGDTPTIRGS